MSNVKFIYLYRDGANYKSWGEVIFKNPELMSLPEIESRLIAAFLEDNLFVASQISILEKFLFLDEKITEYDHCYHEFDCVEICKDNATDSLDRSIMDFLHQVELTSKKGWQAFDILDRV